MLTHLSINIGTDDRMLIYKQIKSLFYTDTCYVTCKVKRIRENIYFHLFVSDKSFVAVYPMKATLVIFHLY